jgi:CubicO group peptidase (beta-lactamase class C family)
MEKAMKLLAGVVTATMIITVAAPAAAQEAAGDWSGTLDVNASVSLPLVVHIKRDDAGALSGTMDSPSQGANGIPLAEVAGAGRSLAFKVPAVQGSYKGQWDKSSKSWKGEWSQGGMSWQLVLGPPRQPAPLPVHWQPPGEAEISALLASRIAPRPGEGVVAGVLGPQGPRVVARGPDGGAAFTGDTLFEIGSISKVFTSLILSDMVARGQVALDDPAEKYLPAGHHMPARGGRKITLLDLATHTSGLPRLPDNMPFADPDDPYADYGEAQLLAFLDRYELPRDIGTKWEYSNLGVGLLGYLLTRAAGKDYETLLRERITGPLQMADTAVALSAKQQARFAPGYDAYMQPAKPWRLSVLAGAGGIRSTTNDMLKFAAAALDPRSPIAPAMKLALERRRPTGNARMEQALGWEVFHPEPGREIVMHDGGTGGFRSSLALEPAKQTAVVVLANSGAEPSTNDLALHLLVGSPVAPTPLVRPAPPPRTAHSEISLPPTELDRVIGRYEFTPGVVFNITRVGNGLHAQRQGAVTGPDLPLFPEAPLKFFWKAVDAQIRFTTDASGQVTGAVFVQNGQSLTGNRTQP